MSMLTCFTGTTENKTALVTGVPMGRLGLFGEVAEGIVFVESDELRFITAAFSTSTVSHRRPKSSLGKIVARFRSTATLKGQRL